MVAIEGSEERRCDDHVVLASVRMNCEHRLHLQGVFELLNLGLEGFNGILVLLSKNVFDFSFVRNHGIARLIGSTDRALIRFHEPAGSGLAAVAM